MRRTAAVTAMAYILVLARMPMAAVHQRVAAVFIPRTEPLSLKMTRMTEEEYAEFAERLSAYHMSQAEFIRQAITGAAIRPIITVSPVNDELLAAVGKLTAEYGRIGGNLNQIARTLNEWHSPYPQLAGEVRAAVSDLAALKFEVLQKVGDAVGNIQTYQL